MRLSGHADAHYPGVMSLKLGSLLGLVSFLLVAWALSEHRRRFPWRTVLWGLALQFALGLLVLKTGLGRGLFELAQGGVTRLIGFANEGAQMVFGPLAKPDLLETHWGAENALVFVTTVSATIIVVSSLSSLLYHLGILQVVVRATAWVMRRTMRTSGSESLATAANIFMGQTEAPLVIRPYLAGLTRSELLALMTGGMATIAGGVFAAYVGFGVSAGHLLTASVMSAPAGLVLAKIMLPEVETSQTAAGANAQVPRDTSNSLEALCRGASEGMLLSLNVMAMLIAFVALVALANFLLAWPQRQVFALLDIAATPVSLQTLVGWVNAPFAWLMGVPTQECVRVGQVLGERVVLNEFVAYLSLTAAKAAGQLSERSYVLATYALCGFANFTSIAIQIGGIGALVPERRQDVARLGLRAMIAGLLACYLTTTVVGVLI